MPDDAIGYAFNDKAATMSITVLNLTEASALLRTINKRDIKDVRAIDLDLALVLESGHKIIISRGAVAAVNSPQLMLEFADGDVALGDVFEKLNHIEVPADAAVTVTSKEITRYGIKRVVKPKVARNKQDQEADKDKTDEETAASPDTDEARPAEALAGNDGSGGSRSGDSGGSDLTARKFTSGKGSSSSLAIQDVADAPADIGSSKGGISWPVIAGGLGLLAAAGGGGGGGGGGGAAASGAGSGSGAGIAATLSGAAALGPLNNATITAYDAEGRVIGKAVPVINGRYTLVLDQSGYKGLILLAIRDNTPGVADNYADEASVRMTDLGNTVLRAVALADGSNQIINVTALTELAALKAGLGTGQTNLAAAQVGATTVTGANAAVSNLFKVDILSGDVAPVTTTDAQGAAVINPAFLQSASVTARNYGIALKAIANLVQTNKERYADNGEAIRKLADALQFTDGLQSRLKWKDGTTQSDLFGESLNARANDPARSQSERDQARTLYDQLQKLPNGSSINDFLLDNHIALSDPAILIKNTTPGGPPWQAPASSGTVILNQEALGNGGLAVRAPPQSKVEVTFIGHDAQGKEVRVKLPVSTADSSGIAVLRPNEAAIELLKQVTREQPVTAQVAVSDGDNSRSANNLWQGNADVRIDIKTPPGLTDFASNKIMLANDSFYTGGEGNDPLRTTPQGNDDLLTSDASVRVVLGNAIKSSERLQFAVATAKSADGQPIYGNWIDPVGLAVDRIDSGGQVHYLARNLVSTDGPVWVKARVVQIGAQFTNGFGGSRELDTPLQFTLDKTAPVKVQLVMAENRDDGVSNSDGISSQSQVTLNPVAAFETGAEVHLRLATAVGTSNTTLQVLRADSTRIPVDPGTWIQWKAGDRLQLIGESRTFNGKARLEVRQIDQAGNYTDSIQTFIADRSLVIEQTVPLANREKAVIEAKAAVVAAVQAADLATGADKAAKQTALATARTALQTAQAAREQALEEARIALTKSDGSTRLADLIGKPVDAAYLPAILRAVAATADPDKVNEARGLTALVDSTIVAANQALDKAKVYGDNDSNPAPTSADFEHMGMAAQLRAVPQSLIDSGKVSGVVDTLAEIRAIVALDLGTLQTLMNYAQGITPIDPAIPALTEPTLAQYDHPDLVAAGAQVTADRLPAINSALRGVGVAGVDAWSKVAGLVKSYTVILNAADGAANGTPATLPTEADFQRVGVKSLQNRFPSGSGDAARSNAVKLLAQAVDRSTAAEVDTSAELDTLADIASRIIRIAAGQPETVTADEWKRLHIGRDYTAEELRVVLPAIAGTADDGSEVNTPSTLAARASNAMGSAERIRKYAGNESGATEPLLEDYRNLGITGVDDVLMVASINSVLESATISAPDVHLPGQVQAIVTAYGKILGQIGNADATRPQPGTHDFEVIGVTPPQSSASLALLNSALARGGKQRADIDTVSELKDLIRASDTVLHIAAGNLSDLAGAPATHAATLQTLLAKLGVTGLQPDSMPAVLTMLKASADDGSGVDTLAKLQTLATSTSTAQNRIHAYADDANQPAPVLHAQPDASHINTIAGLNRMALVVEQLMKAGSIGPLGGAAEGSISLTVEDLQWLGVTGVSSDNLGFVLSKLQSLTDPGSLLVSLAALQSLATAAINAREHLVKLAQDNTGALATAAELDAIGLTLPVNGAGSNAEYLKLFNDALKSPAIDGSRANTPALLQAIIGAAQRVVDSTLDHAPAAPTRPIPADLIALGLPPGEVASVPAANMNLLIDAITARSFSNLGVDHTGTALALPAKLSHLLGVIASVRNSAATGLPSTDLSAAHLQELGLTLTAYNNAAGTPGHHLPAILSAIAASGSEVGSLAALQTLASRAASAQDKILHYADEAGSPTAPAPTAEDYRAIGLARLETDASGARIALVSPDRVAAINAALHAGGIGPDKADTPAGIKRVVTAYNAILDSANGTAGDTAVALTGDGNTSIGSLKSYQMFDKLGASTTFSLLQQGSSLDTLGAWLRLGLKPAATAGLNNVALEMLGGFKRNSVDQYKVNPDLETGLSDVGLANIGLLYQLSVANTSSRPVIRVRFDSSNNVAGNVIELYEGGRLVGSKTLVASDLGGGPKEVDVAVFQSLSAGKHDLEVRYTDTGGNSVNSNLSVNVAAGGAPVTLSDLGVRGNKQSASEAQSLGQSGASYAVISDADTSFASGHGNQGPVFVGTVGGGSASDRYLVTIQMGGKVVAFEDVGAGSFAIGIPAGVLPPGYYQDLSISATVLTPGARLGQTTSMQGLKLGWYWAAQAGTSIVGGNGNDELVLGAAADPEIVGGIRVQTGAGDDKITVGSFGKTSGLKATVTDFTVGMDRVKVFGQILNQDFVKNYVTASDLNGSTQLQIDLDGAGAGKLYYHLTLQGVQYNPSMIGSIFGV
ncbi:UNVERIFIED_ORG: hypothetical protein DFO49_0255 [Herbaspirillum seropedicae]